MIAAICARKSAELGRKEQAHVEITFSSDAKGSLIRVLRGGRFFGVIFLNNGVYRFHTGEEAGPDLEDTDLEQLKTKIEGKCEGAGE
jgi:hypothetical protein